MTRLRVEAAALRTRLTAVDADDWARLLSNAEWDPELLIMQIESAMADHLAEDEDTD